MRYWQNVSGLFRDFCYKQQNQTTKNGNSTQKKVHIFKSNAPILLKLGVGLDHMYTKEGLDCFCSSCVMFSKNTTMCKSFLAKGEIMQQTLSEFSKLEFSRGLSSACFVRNNTWRQTKVSVKNGRFQSACLTQQYSH